MKHIRKNSKTIAVFLLLNFIQPLLSPLLVSALTSGPSQPESSSFQPISVSDMVDPFSGDFSYNIPLIDVEGYPINLSYNSGIGSDQEASWVGLGWNINPGAITRNMRGIPDEFNGDIIETEYNMRPNSTIGSSVSAKLGEFFGFKIPENGPFSLSYSLGINYNNYNGFGIEQTFTPSFSSGDGSKGEWNASLGLTAGQNGLTVKPNISYSKNSKDIENSDKVQRNTGFSIGSSYNSRSGMGGLSLNMTNGSAKDKKLSGSVGTNINFGMSTYTPSIQMPMRNINLSFSYKIGAEFTGTFPAMTISGYLSEQAMNLRNNSQKSPAYGYTNSQNVPKDSEGRNTGVMDINRSWDGGYNQNTPSLPVTNYTFDILSVAGQGLGGSFRAFRNDLGYVADNKSSNISAGGSMGGETGGGNLLKLGADIAVNLTNTTVSSWSPYSNGFLEMSYSYSNPAANRLKWKSESPNNHFEPYTYKQMGELSVDDEPELFENIGSNVPVRIGLISNGSRDFNVRTSTNFETKDGDVISMQSDMHRKKRIKRNQTLSILTFADLPYKGLGSNNHPLYAAPKHHTGEITVIRNDGARYVYGVPAYNTKQEETTFNMGMRRSNLFPDENISGHKALINGETGLIRYAFNNSDPKKGDNSVSNNRGKDHYYQSIKMPPFAHSYLLSAVLSTDYVDADNVRGPSAGDLGNYTVFKYTKSKTPYKWRTPFGSGTANYNEGLRSTFSDDKANYIYGEKELWYLERIETKNSIAIFTLEARKDGWGVEGRNGGFGDEPMMKLVKISLYSKADYDENQENAIPIKEVHFEYDYSLCPETENNIDFYNGETDPTKIGKLTLKKVYFTYGNSNRSAFSPYTFDYTNLYDEDFNPKYALKNHDRWGNYKENKGSILRNDGAMPNSDFPYVIQNKEEADKNSSAWTLSKINLPSGGVITIHTESDDYAFVQDKRAMQMFTIEGISGEENPTNPADFFEGNSLMDPLVSLTPNGNNLYMSFKLDEPIPISGNSVEIFRKKYLEGIENLYFKAYVQIDDKIDLLGRNKNFEYVTGFAEIDGSGLKAHNATSGYYNYGYIKLKEVNQGQKDFTANVNPISKAAWYFARTQLSDLVYNGTDDETFGVEKFISKIQNAGFIKGIIQTLQGANGYLKNNDFCKKINLSKSFIRLNNPNKKKLGGGLRVKKILLSDEWDKMVAGNAAQSYGQSYEYTTKDDITGEEISSGVAAWEPQIGSDENPFSLPVWFGDKRENLLIANNKSYLIGPMGQEFYPAPSVGYSKVTVSNISHVNIKRHATGKIINEFYTAKDFPAISTSTGIDPKPRKSNPIAKLFKMDYKDFVTVSQGHSIELNDMHGKQKAMWVFQEDSEKPISGVEYKYQCERYGKHSFKLVNDAVVVRPNGTTETRPIGIEYDFVTDFRQEETSTISGGLNTNLSNFLIGFVPGIVPTVLPSVQKEFTRFRSAVTTKVINRYGILEETIAHDLGSKVSTKNLAYDSESGLILLTKTKNNFEDEIYNFNYPAHWYYDQMGQAYKNLGMKFQNIVLDAGGKATINNATEYFVPGDELVADNIDLAWVSSIDGNVVTFINEMGNPFKPSTTVENMIITRSGRRNLIGVSMGSITSLSNPLPGLRSGSFSNVLNTNAQVFKDEWGTFCECFENNSRLKNSKNPYVIGTRGIYRAYKSFAYLINRTHTWRNNNTDIRKDGVYGSYNPYWKWSENSWEQDQTNWTWTSEITEMNPYGAELENMDALFRFSAAVYGYNNTIPTAVGANTKYREIAFDGFEDYDFNTCSDDHFSYKPDKASVANQGHTGKKSMSVSSENPITVSRTLIECEPEEE